MVLQKCLGLEIYDTRSFNWFGKNFLGLEIYETRGWDVFAQISWVWKFMTCVPAAFLRSGSRLSGIEPWFPVTRQNQLWASMPQSTVDRAPLRRTCRRRMAVRSAQSHSESPEELPKQFGFGLAPLTCVWGFVACIRSRITVVIQVAETVQCIRCDLMSHLRFHLNSACTAHAWFNFETSIWLLAGSTR